MITDGLYLSIDDDGNIERYLLLDNEKIELEPTTIKNEIIEFSDSNFTPYEELMDTLGEIANQVTFQQLEFKELYTLAYDICEELTKSNIIWGRFPRLFWMTTCYMLSTQNKLKWIQQQKFSIVLMMF